MGQGERKKLWTAVVYLFFHSILFWQTFMIETDAWTCTAIMTCRPMVLLHHGSDLGSQDQIWEPLFLPTQPPTHPTPSAKHHDRQPWDETCRTKSKIQRVKSQGIKAVKQSMSLWTVSSLFPHKYTKYTFPVSSSLIIIFFFLVLKRRVRTQANPWLFLMEGVGSWVARMLHRCPLHYEDAAQFWWRFMCRARWSEREKLRLQTAHWKGLAPVCFR